MIENELGDSFLMSDTLIRRESVAGNVSNSETSSRMKAAGKRRVLDPFWKLNTANLKRESTPSKILFLFSKPNKPVI